MGWRNQLGRLKVAEATTRLASLVSRPYRHAPMSPTPSPAPPRILVAAYQIRARSNGGMESATRLFEALSDTFDWSLVTTRDMPRTQRWRDRGARVAIAPFNSEKPRWYRRLQGIAWSARLGREILRSRPAVVHCNDIQSYQAYSFLPAFLRRAPLLFTLRDTRPPGDRPGAIWHALAQEARAIVVLSKEMGARLVEDVPGASDKITVINSIVDLDRYAPANPADRRRIRTRLGIGDDELVIACIGAVGEKKGQLDLIRKTWPQVKARLPAARLHLLGDCDTASSAYTQDVVAAARAAPGAGVVVHGHVDGMAEWYKASDVICIAARNEGLARAMIEGMASGVPVVSFDVCSAKEMLSATGAGVVVETGDHDGLAAALVALDDPHRRHTMGMRGRETALALFDQAHIAGQWHDLYQSVLRYSE